MDVWNQLSIAVVVELLVVILLLTTLWFCLALNTRLKHLRSDEARMLQLVADLTEVSERSQHAIVSLRDLSGSLKMELSPVLDRAETLRYGLEESIKNGEDVLYCIGKVTRTAKGTRSDQSRRSHVFADGQADDIPVIREAGVGSSRRRAG